MSSEMTEKLAVKEKKIKIIIENINSGWISVVVDKWT